MSEFELLILPKNYLVTRSHWTPYYKFVNKSYDKPRFQYECVSGKRISSPTSFLSDLDLEANLDALLFILLGPKDVCGKLQRDFDLESQSLQDAYACDIPKEYFEKLRFNASKVKIKEINDDYDLQDDLYRVLASSGYLVKETFDNQLTLELTAFTSFMRSLGSLTFEFVVENYLQNLKFLEYTNNPQISSQKYDKVLIEAYVIREHGLVDFYIKKCKFQPTTYPDKLFKPELTTTSKRIIAKAEFSLAIFHREVDII
ncbi:hypothetical protein PSN45_000083 [Yamadazyma tenuis]|uniref:Uncharacterized protein n=1 Tax=Candida tenuis (strain ATCC 10573 / BCRC 21748 / CBS 615 / JCM 9827 / NBRC 10315 / NRRL Y-1498 / VKM Y-70) TaxID=590646 RepID=G3BAI7_CANTC|nr:uncharacterized protein CANTEDRAFT_94317 [Yamadazyma tenuis ATCC 10573]EGV61411.1 hypothetical protein CANTEDRAFT_94317 [Yamadazyma tenuis ATCC 10573]WEJ92630.1 hypothetical protein PSN45_000083 [Yamadazyma tenuis]